LAGTTTLPDWLKEAGSLTSGHDLTALKARLLQLPLDKHLSVQSLIIPVRKAPDRPLPEKTRNLFAVSDSTVWAQPNHSAVGDTQIVIFASRYPERCSLRMPPGTVVTELDSSSPARWQSTGREQLTVEINSPITTLRARWMSERAAGTLTKLSVQIGPPYPFDCEFRQTLTLYSSTGDQPILTSADSISTDSFRSALAENVQAGLNHARPVTEPTTNTSNAPTLPLEQSILDLFEQTRSQFLTGMGVGDVTDYSPAHCELVSTAPMIVEMNREADWTTVAALFMGASVILIATFARLLNSLPFRLLPRRSTSFPVAPSGPATVVVHTASVRSDHSGSQSRPRSGPPSVPRTSPDKPGSSVDVRSMDHSAG
jgi:hypothetical protein